MKIELLYFPGCPHIEAARTQLRAALKQTRLTLEWSESEVTRGYGSPTILVNGVDVLGALPSSAGDSCRLYAGSELPGAPPLDDLVRALGVTA